MTVLSLPADLWQVGHGNFAIWAVDIFALGKEKCTEKCIGQYFGRFKSL